MSESGMRQRVMRALRPLDAVPVENPVRPGTPDVNYIEGWVELKWERSWPKRDTTPLRVPHFTSQQRMWLRRRSRMGGHVHLLLQVGRVWMLFEGAVAARVLGHSTRSELESAAVRVWRNGMRDGELVRCLRSRPHPQRDCSSGGEETA